MRIDIRARSLRLYYLLGSCLAVFWAGRRGNPPGGLLLGYSTAALGWVTPAWNTRDVLLGNTRDVRSGLSIWNKILRGFEIRKGIWSKI